MKSVQSCAQKGWSDIGEQSGLKLLQFEAGLELRVAHPDKGDAVTSILNGSGTRRGSPISATT